MPDFLSPFIGLIIGAILFALFFDIRFRPIWRKPDPILHVYPSNTSRTVRFVCSRGDFDYTATLDFSSYEGGEISDTDIAITRKHMFTHHGIVENDENEEESNA